MVYPNWYCMILLQRSWIPTQKLMFTKS